MAIFELLFLVMTALVSSGCTGSRPTSVLANRAEPLTVTSADGHNVQFDDLWQNRKATVLIFWSGGCPCVRRYQERANALLDQYPADTVRIVAISSNAGESFADAMQVAKERGVRIPLFRDEGGRVAEAVGARSTPTVVVIDARGSIRYRGWIDNERLPGDPDREPYLERAITGLLADRNDFADRSPIYGCAITRSLFGASPASCNCNHQHH